MLKRGENLVPVLLTLYLSLDATFSEPSSPTNGNSGEDENRLSDVTDLHVGDGDSLSIWKVEEGKTVATNPPTYTAFESDKSYIVQVNSKQSCNDWRHWRTFYWIGRSASESNAGEAAYQAVLRDYRLHPIVNIRKEAEGHESSIFKALPFRDKEVECSSIVRSLEEVNEKATRLFVIQEPEENQRRFKEVNPVVDHVVKEDCLVLVSETVYVYCGSGTSEKQRRGAEALAEIMTKKRKLNKEPTVIHRTPVDILTPEKRHKTAHFLMEFHRVSEADQTCQIVERTNEFTPAEVRRTLSQTELEEDGSEWFDINVYKVYEDYPFILKPNQRPVVFDARVPVLRNQPTTLNILNTKECYIADTRSNAGLFVWMGSLSKLSVRSETARRAELLLRKRAQHNYATPVTYIDQEAVPSRIGTLQTLVRFLDPIKNNLKRLRLK